MRTARGDGDCGGEFAGVVVRERIHSVAAIRKADKIDSGRVHLGRRGVGLHPGDDRAKHLLDAAGAAKAAAYKRRRLRGRGEREQMAGMPRLELLRSDEVEQRPLVELLEQVRPDLAFPGDVDDEGNRLAPRIWRSVGEARELRTPVNRPPGGHPISPKFLRKLALGRNRRHLDCAMGD